MKKYKFLFIDLDDTLWDFHTNAKLALYDVFVEQNLFERFQDFDTFYNMYSKRNIELWTQYGQGLITKEFLSTERFLYPLQKVGINDAELATNMNAHFLDVLATKTELIPYAREILDFMLKKQIPVTLISNGFIEVQYKKMRNTNIEHYFTHIVLSEMAGALKPNPEIFNYATNLNNAEKKDILMVGDSFEADIKGALSAGIDAAFYNPRNSSYESVKTDNNLLNINHLKELTTLF